MTGDPRYFPEQEPEDLEHIRSEILRYRSTFLMNDRERAHFLGLPEGCRIRENAKILHPDLFKCGTDVWIGEGAILDAQGGLEVGDNTQIGLSVMVEAALLRVIEFGLPPLSSAMLMSPLLWEESSPRLL